MKYVCCVIYLNKNNMKVFIRVVLLYVTRSEYLARQFEVQHRDCLHKYYFLLLFSGRGCDVNGSFENLDIFLLKPPFKPFW